jgi:hypothetical protein
VINAAGKYITKRVVYSSAPIVPAGVGGMKRASVTDHLETSTILNSFARF